MSSKLAIGEYVTSLYLNLLNRHPEPGVIESWTERINAGASVEELTTQFVACDELAQRRKMLASLWVPPGHFYSPIVDVNSVQHLLHPPNPERLEGIEISKEEHLLMWRRLLPHLMKFPFTENKVNRFRYYHNNWMYGIGDASIYFAMLLELKPKKIIEIGSGFSSACALDTISREFDDPVEMTFIEPYPDTLNSLLSEHDRQHVKLLQTGVQQVDLDVFRSLDAGDILFIDSTHVSKTGSDVNFELFEILPSLKKGVIIHFHDIFWPFEYPAQWISEGRSWNELYTVRAFLMYQDEFKIRFFNHYAALQLEPIIRAEYPNFLINPGGGLWLEKSR